MKSKLRYSAILIFLFLFFPILITGCNSPNNKEITLHSLLKINEINFQREIPSKSFYSAYPLPISIPAGEFSRVIGWLKDEEIIYMTRSFEGSSLYRHDLNSGKSNLIYVSKNPIVSIQISPDQKNILIHSSPSTYEGQMTLINIEGEEWFSKLFPSVEMVYEWNQYNSNQLLITAFQEDWSFENYLFDLKDKRINLIDLRKPFSKWTGKDKLAFLDWNDEGISLVSPLIQKELGKAEILLKEDIFQFETFIDNIMTFTVDPKERLASYTFYGDDMVEKISFKTPVLSSYSGWIVPNYEITADQKEFLTMMPIQSSEADAYRGGFQFISFNLGNGKKETILDLSDNLPFTCSPNKKYCLVGYQLEKLLNLRNKMMISLF